LIAGNKPGREYDDVATDTRSERAAQRQKADDTHAAGDSALH